MTTFFFFKGLAFIFEGSSCSIFLKILKGLVELILDKLLSIQA